MLFGINRGGSFLFSLFPLLESRSNVGSNKKYVVRRKEMNGAGVQKGKCRRLSDDVVRQIGLY